MGLFPKKYRIENLQQAILAGSIDEAKVCIAKGIDVKKKTGLGFSPLWKAAANDRTSICEKLIDHGADAKDCAATLKTFKDAGLVDSAARNVEKFLNSIGTSL